jgi:hypothetical protein
MLLLHGQHERLDLSCRLRSGLLWLLGCGLQDL